MGLCWTIGTGPDKMTVDLRTMRGQRMALENIAYLPKLQQTMGEFAREQFGGNEDMLALGTHRLIFGGHGTLTESERYRTRGPGRPGVALGGGGNLSAEEAEEAARLEARQRQPGGQLMEREARIEAGLERLGEPLVQDGHRFEAGHRRAGGGQSVALRD